MKRQFDRWKEAFSWLLLEERVSLNFSSMGRRCWYNTEALQGGGVPQGVVLIQFFATSLTGRRRPLHHMELIRTPPSRRTLGWSRSNA